MSISDKAKRLWDVLSRDPAVLAGTIQLVLALSDIVTRFLKRRREASWRHQDHDTNPHP